MNNGRTHRIGFAVIAIAFVFLATISLANDRAVDIPEAGAVIESVAIPVPNEVVTLFIVGDIMLGRDVENRMQSEGFDYPFRFMKTFIETADLSVGNFEGIVSEIHTQTPTMGFSFSIRNEYLTYLKHVGFDILSLANNHSYDYGEHALQYTRSICTELSILCGGSPTSLDSFSSSVHSVKGQAIGFIFINAVSGELSETELQKHIEKVTQTSDTQIAFIHWGNEYEQLHSRAQQVLAEALIDQGVDAVIGHHPHVVQDITVYKNKPIFYSLGNFIFDQYFSDAVQHGLGIQLSIDDEKLVYTLIPFTSVDSRNQPRIVNSGEAAILTQNMLRHVSAHNVVDMTNGSMTFLKD